MLVKCHATWLGMMYTIHYIICHPLGVYVLISTYVHIATYMPRPPRAAWRATSVYSIRRQRVISLSNHVCVISLYNHVCGLWKFPVVSIGSVAGQSWRGCPPPPPPTTAKTLSHKSTKPSCGNLISLYNHVCGKFSASVSTGARGGRRQHRGELTGAGGTLDGVSSPHSAFSKVAGKSFLNISCKFQDCSNI